MNGSAADPKDDRTDPTASFTVRVPRPAGYIPQEARAIRSANVAAALAADRVRRGLRTWSDWGRP